MNQSVTYKGYELHTEFKDGGHSVTTIVKDNVIISMTYSSNLDKNNSERKAQIKIDNNFSRDHQSLLSELK